MSDSAIVSSVVIKTFLGETGKHIQCFVPNSNQYVWIVTLKQAQYFTPNKKDKSMVKAYIQSVTYHSRAQITRLISVFEK